MSIVPGIVDPTRSGTSVGLRTVLVFASGCAAGASLVVAWQHARRNHSQLAASEHGGVDSDSEFQLWGNKLLVWISNYRRECRSKPVIAQVEPNFLRNALPTAAPEASLCFCY